MIINNILKKVVNVKAEILLITIYIPFMIINIFKSSMIISASVIHLLLIIGLCYGMYSIRQDIKKYIYQLKPIRVKIIDLKAIKKEIFLKVFNKKPTTAFIKYNALFK